MALQATTSELARFLNVTTTQLRKLEADGVVKKAGKNNWDPTKAAASYIRHLQKELGVGPSGEPIARTTGEVLTQAQVADILGVSMRRVRQRDLEDSPPPKNDAGRYPATQFGKWLLDDFRRGLGISEDGTVYDYDAERARLTHHQANSAAIEEQAKNGTLVHVDLVRQAWSDIVASARAKLIGLPSRLASSCAGKPAAGVELEARGIVNEALEELANGGDGVPCTD